MSAYSHSKKVLSASELFKYRLKRDNSLPVKGGQKDFKPDGSWMQVKALETLIQEKTAIISEPRVEKLKHLVEGVWDETKRLVNLKRPGKFWMHMGFTDNRRNWLYPEEALFLMESNNLEIFYNSVPFSIQEAYMKMLGTDVTVEEYQVFAHLRRLGFVVLRHEKEQAFTDYECKIKLDQYCKKKKKKCKNKTKQPFETAHNTSEDHSQQFDKSVEESSSSAITEVESSFESASAQEKSDDVETDDKKKEGNQDLYVKRSNYDSNSNMEGGSQKRPLSLSTDDTTLNGSNKKICSRDDMNPITHSDADTADFIETKEGTFRDFYNVSSWSLCHNKENENCADESNEENICMTQTAMDQMTDDLFPDIANKETLTLPCPDSVLTSSNKDGLDKIIFDVEDYRAKNPAAPMTKEDKYELDQEMHVKDLNFSSTKWTHRKSQIQAKNWSDFKQKMQEKAVDTSASSPLDYLWRDSVTPLIKPEDASSYGRILENLQIVQSANNETLLPETGTVSDEIKISYDVHLPDNKFKKSMPGVPNHRICVSSLDTGPPSLAVIQHMWNLYKDGVPLHWAFVDSGEITFLVFNNSHCLETLQQ